MAIVTCLGLMLPGSAALADREARVYLLDRLWCAIGWCPEDADSLSGQVNGEPTYSLIFESVGTDPIPNATMSLLPPQGVELGWVEYEQGDTWYRTVGPRGASYAWVPLNLTEWRGFWAQCLGCNTTVDTGLTVSRSVPQPVLTNDIQEQTMYLDLRLDRPMPAGINLIEVWLGQESSPELQYELLSVTKPPEFIGGAGWYGVDPHDLTVGATYRFEVLLRVARSGSLAGGILYHRPCAEVHYSQHVDCGPETAGSMVLAVPSGARARFAASELTTFYGETQADRVELVFKSVVARVGHAAPESVLLGWGQERRGTGSLCSLTAQLQGDNILGATLTSPTEKKVTLRPAGLGRWEFQTIDPAVVGDFTPGVYTFTCFSTDGSQPVEVEIDTSDLQAGPNEIPNITAPAGDTTDSLPVVSWTPPTDPNVNGIMVQVHGADEEVILQEVLPPSADSAQVAAPLDCRGYKASVMFLSGREGQTAQGVDYSVGRYTGADRYFNLVPFIVTASLDWDWVYQNTPVTTLDRHLCRLTLNVTEDSAGPQNYMPLVGERGGGNNVTIQSTAAALEWNIVGGRMGSSTPGPVTLDVFLRGATSGAGAPAAAALTLRLLGNIDGVGDVNGDDKAQMNRRLNSLSVSYPDRAFNLNGDTEEDGVTPRIDGDDKAVMNRLLNSLTIQ